ncbi:GNAT family N-acetyltransferase [Melittangium boletus]|uniref:GNAT family N-acetyltransferase n=1 Tax=Melittangium boletus DSM 14713 TaxID=1294270 RepID=A0A250IKI5_9BACT|nr:GNAT family N-acetyltransferase [Melittangium boletus]ATB32275.1 GNAT family N-acetyltransferase [Melittangium boletus DSM 14713]
MSTEPRIEEVSAEALDLELLALADVLHASVQDGASVGFVLPFSVDAASDFWCRVRPALQTGARRLFVARWEGRVVGTVQLVLDTPPNGRHRAEIAKMLVHPAARRRGIARALMLRAEDEARRAGRSLLVLDTVPGNASERLYRSLGFQVTGMVPEYACSIHGALEPSLFMHKSLRDA